jgi:UDP-N-acetylmuramate: L-alanyl-gamma-D-glutamyl-meso-diaminopimelate ligase
MNRAVVDWEMTGLHNVRNGMAAVAAAHHVGVDVSSAQEALNLFKGVKRRLELRGEVGGIEVYDDFAHHPTAIAATLAGLVAKLAVVTEQSRLIAVIEPKSNTMKLGVHQDQLAASCQAADMVVWQQPEQSKLDFEALVAASKVPAYVFREVDEIVSFLEENCRAGDRIVVMSNGGFGRIHEKLLEAFDPGPAGSHRL